MGKISKNILPIVERYGIDTENDRNFSEIMELFGKCPNYQVWALRLFYSHVSDIEAIKLIAEWIKSNKRSIRNLERENVILYCDEIGIHQLLREIEGDRILSTIKKSIAKFNTRQRKELRLALTDNMTPFSAGSSNLLKHYAGLFSKFEEFSDWRKQNFIKKVSGISDVCEVLDRLEECFDGDYEWKKESLFEYMSENTPNVKVILDNGQHVILEIPDFKSARKLAGNGRTEWCISMREEMWNDYLEGRTQYFIYDFSRPDCDTFANIAFTVSEEGEIDFAQTIDNNSMIDGYDDGIEFMDIKAALEAAGTSISEFTRK